MEGCNDVFCWLIPYLIMCFYFVFSSFLWLKVMSGPGELLLPVPVRYEDSG